MRFGKWIAFIVIRCQECERRKEGKDEEIKREAIRPASKKKRRGKRSLSEWDWGQCSFGELCEWEQVKEKSKIIESKRKLWEIHSEKKAVSKKKKRVFIFCSSYISEYCNLYLILWNYLEFVRGFFPLRRKGLHVNFCVLVWLYFRYACWNLFAVI